MQEDGGWMGESGEVREGVDYGVHLTTIRSGQSLSVDSDDCDLYVIESSSLR